MASKYPAPNAWGSLWWRNIQNEQVVWFEVRTSITQRYAEEDARQRKGHGMEPLLFLPMGHKPTPDARRWADYGPPDP